jgi:single-strand DNA-binding protein
MVTNNSGNDGKSNGEEVFKMADMKVVSLTGRLTKDAVLKKAGQYDLCEFTIAVNGFKPEDTFFMVVDLWGKQAIDLNPFLKKGKQIALTGDLKMNKWQDMDGNNRKEYRVNGNRVTLLGSKQQELPEAEENFDEKIPF